LFARREADGLPFVLHADNELGHRFPFGHGGERIEVEGLDLFAKLGLLVEVFLFFLFAAEEKVLVALIDEGGSGFESVPNFFALLFGYGAGFAKFLMKFLQRVESGDHIFVFGELFGSFAEADFYFEVLFEVVGAHFVVETQQVIDLLHVVVEVFPRFGDVLGGDVADFLPFGLQGFEAVVFFVDLFGLCHHLFEFVDEGELFFQVGLACGFGFGGDFGADFFDRSDEAFVFLFVGIDRGDEIFGFTALGHKGFAGFADFVVVQPIENVAQAIEDGAIGGFGLLHILPQEREHFGLGGGGRDLFGRFGRRVHSVGRCGGGRIGRGGV
jgi:hypothetical protein